MKKACLLLTFALSLFVPGTLHATEFSFPIGQPAGLTWFETGAYSVSSFHLDLSYDRQLFSILYVGPAGAFASDNAQFTRGVLDPSAGLIRGISGSVNPAAEPVDGNTNLLTVLFQPFALGKGSMVFLNYSFVDATGVAHANVPSDAADITVFDPNAVASTVPEPGSSALALAGAVVLAGMLAMRRRATHYSV